jgi:hypothetical protein
MLQLLLFEGAISAVGNASTGVRFLAVAELVYLANQNVSAEEVTPIQT